MHIHVHVQMLCIILFICKATSIQCQVVEAKWIQSKLNLYWHTCTYMCTCILYIMCVFIIIRRYFSTHVCDYQSSH